MAGIISGIKAASHPGSFIFIARAGILLTIRAAGNLIYLGLSKY